MTHYDVAKSLQVRALAKAREENYLALRDQIAPFKRYEVKHLTELI